MQYFAQSNVELKFVK